MQLDGQVAIVTGVGSREGIGFAIAKGLFAAGAHVAITSTTERIHERARELDPSAIRISGYAADLTDETAAQNLVSAVLKRTGCIDILVNNAGMAQTWRPLEFKKLQDSDLATWRRQIEITLYTAYLMTRAVLPAMTKRKYGRIGNVSSGAAP